MLRTTLTEAAKELAWTLSAVAVAVAFYSNAWKQQTLEAPNGYVVVETAYSVGIMFIFYLFGKVYCNEWRSVAKARSIISIYERWVLPLGAISFPFLLNVFDVSVIPILIEKWELLFAILLLGILMDWNFSVRKRVLVALEQHDGRFEGQRFLYLKFPPQDRLDLLPQDILLNGAWIALLVRHVLRT